MSSLCCNSDVGAICGHRYLERMQNTIDAEDYVSALGILVPVSVKFLHVLGSTSCRVWQHL